MTDWEKTDDLEIALRRRFYIYFHLRETLMRLIFIQNIDNFHPQSRTARDDAAVIGKQEAYIGTVAAKVSSKRREFEMSPQPLPKTIVIYAKLALSMLK